MTTAPRFLVDLPDRPDDVVRGLSAAFRLSQVDYLPNSVCRYRDRWLISTDAWGDRRLGQFDPAARAWTEFPAPAGWIRRPMSDGGEHLSLLRHEHHADDGAQLALRDGRWDVIEEGVEEGGISDWDGRLLAHRSAAGNAAALTSGGELVQAVPRPDGTSAIIGPGWNIPMPRGATLSHLSPSPDREAVLAVIRSGSSYQTVVFACGTGRVLSSGSLRKVLLPTSAWLDGTRVVVCAEEWPSVVPYVWDWSSGSVEPVWAPGAVGSVRSVAAAPDGTCVAAVGAPTLRRSLRALGDTSLPDPGGEVRDVIVRRGDQLLPCLVHEPPGARRGTAFFVPGGPHVPVWGEFTSLATALAEAGWRVVRVNLRSSGLRQPEFRPKGPVRYGADDVADLCAVIEELGDGPVVTMGMSYGGYVAGLAGELSDRCVGVALLGGFLHHDDLAGTTHPGVRQFAGFAFRDRAPLGAARLRKRYFLAHGELDNRIPMSAVLRHIDRMDQQATFVELDGEGHAIRTDRGARLAYPPLLQWMDDVEEACPKS
ncbi:alpha/beta hydrolase family protein [Amycolatopsis alba]|uniref:Alpha/beta hydrolase n=1 Tax=Amycolatopsis alba DSM 44262 TaxID=1125972 RepID=A0A229RPB6_AMYAL|nr:alpha/beta fold hydrolase [Amycolatopsis alba]OXM48497.1 alpha/beta hydrolase [Amycolatopsis alba DSM 44262]